MSEANRHHDRQGKKIHYTHSYLWTASRSALFQTQRDPIAGRYAGWGLLALISGALAAEAYLNYLGPKIMPKWGRKEDRLPPRDKLRYVAEAVGYPMDVDGTAYMAFCEVFKLRNRLAHGRPEQVDGSWSVTDEGLDGQEALEPDWLRATTAHSLFNMLGHVQDLLDEIALSAGEESAPFVVITEGETRGRPHIAPE